MPARALLVSCSKTKVAANGPLPAIDLYDGPYYRIFRKLRREGAFPSDLDIFIISARYGLIPSYKRIETYEQAMDRQRAAGLRPSLIADIEGWIRRGQYAELFVNLGRVYLEAVDGYDKLLPRGVRVIEVKGEIGRRMSAMKKWILR